MKNKLVIILIILCSLSGIILFLIPNKSKVSIINFETKLLDSQLNTDKDIGNTEVYGYNSVIGKTYKSGDTVVYDGIAIKVEEVGFSKKVSTMDYSNTEDMGYMIFKLTLYNKNLSPFEIKEDSINLMYGNINNWISDYYQSLHNSGYSQWKYFENSFNLENVPSQKIRSGYIFFPCNLKVRDGGYLKIEINNVPLYFKFKKK